MARRRQGRIDDLKMEREFEERVEGKRRRPAVRENSGSGESKYDRKKTKPPLLLRFLAWCGVILFCFVVGYVGTGYLVDKFGLNEPWSSETDSSGSGGTVSLPADVMEGSEAERLEIQKATFSVFYPKDGNLVSENIDVISRTLEDNIQEAVLRILQLSGAGEAVNVLHIFRDVETVYLDISSPFLDFLSQAGREFGTLLVNGIARTMNENFSLNRVRFLVDSRVVSSGAPIDLSAEWTN